MIYNLLPTRATLYLDGIFKNPICNLCNTEEQTLHHLLINCTLAVDFWILFQDWWYQKPNKTITLSTSHIPYGWQDKALASPKLLSTDSQIWHFLHKPLQRCLRFSNLPTVQHRKTWNSKRDRDCKKELHRNFIARGLFYFNFISCWCLG